MKVSTAEMGNKTNEIIDLISLGDVQAANRLAIALAQGLVSKNETNGGSEDDKEKEKEKEKVNTKFRF